MEIQPFCVRLELITDDNALRLLQMPSGKVREEARSEEDKPGDGQSSPDATQALKRPLAF